MINHSTTLIKICEIKGFDKNRAKLKGYIYLKEKEIESDSILLIYSTLIKAVLAPLGFTFGYFFMRVNQRKIIS